MARNYGGAPEKSLADEMYANGVCRWPEVKSLRGI